jgi:dTDP-4-dehydrorhamnose reductase
MRSGAEDRQPAPLELWGGVECTVNRVRDGYLDQLELTGHASRIEDLDRIAALGIQRCRYPVLWERVAPAGLDSCDWQWSDARLSRLQSLGIAPIAGLVHHGSGPRYATLLDDSFPERLAEYARSVSRRYPWIDAYTPINEPLTTARFTGLYGHWYPHGNSDRTFVAALLNQCRGIVLAMRAVRDVNPSATLVQTDDVGKTFSTAALAYQAEFENHRRWLAWDLLSARVDRDHPLWDYLLSSGATTQDLDWFLDRPCPPDIVGLNYYLTSDRFLDETVSRYPGVRPGGNGRQTYVDVEAVRAAPSISGHRAMLTEAWERYRTPVALTEVHLGCTREEQLRWLMEAWDGARGARRSGADVRAVTAWGLFGLSDWDSLVTLPQGHYEPGAYDARGIPPRPTALAAMVRELAAAREPTDVVLSSPGWWRRESRFIATPPADTYPGGVPPQPARTRVRPARKTRRPIAVTGAAGTLGQAFRRVCAVRGLECEMLSRQDLEIRDDAAIGRTLDRLQPWAVMNAAGYVRVDDAEGEPEECRLANAVGPALLAEACANRGIRFVTFSSDLVFDGAAGRPYVESDRVCPLSVYGRTKAAGECLVLEACAEALVVRTSAFFGPWDRWNVVHLALEAIAAGRAFTLPPDQRVSPTYVPDLAHASLDLLIDGASGVWHLVNDGDVSWRELVTRAAVLSGYPIEAVDACCVHPGPRPARRPPYSVLGTERGQLLPALDDALQRFVAARRASGDPRQSVESPAEVLSGMCVQK